MLYNLWAEFGILVLQRDLLFLCSSHILQLLNSPSSANFLPCLSFFFLTSLPATSISSSIPTNSSQEKKKSCIQCQKTEQLLKKQKKYNMGEDICCVDMDIFEMRRLKITCPPRVWSQVRKLVNVQKFSWCTVLLDWGDGWSWHTPYLGYVEKQILHNIASTSKTKKHKTINNSYMHIHLPCF